MAGSATAIRTCQVTTAAPCTKPSDCCVSVPSDYTCNEDSPYLYQCNGGFCESAKCATDAHCEQYLSQFKLAGYAPLGCVEGACQATNTRACVQASDCCRAVPSGYTCGKDIPYIYECKSGYCAPSKCTASAQCERQFNEVYAPVGYRNLGCVAGECKSDYPTACSTPSDCCAAVPATYTCNKDFPYLYECKGGYCASVACTNSEQCQQQFETTFEPLGYQNLGCVSGKCNVDFRSACVQTSDCCKWVPATYSCGVDYPYLYECRAGRCESLGCESTEQCERYLSNTFGPISYTNLGCS